MEVKIPLERRVLGINIAEACISAADEYGLESHELSKNGSGYDLRFSYPGKAKDILTVKGITSRGQREITLATNDDLRVRAARDIIEGYRRILATQLQFGWGSNGVSQKTV